MKIRNLVAGIIALTAIPAALADVTMTVNGQKVEKAVASMSFDGDLVKVTYADNSVSSHDMGDVALSFASPSGMGEIASFGTLAVAVDGDLHVTGIEAGCVLQVFDVRGSMVAGATATSTECVVTASHLEPGLYILKAGKEIVKFVKR